MAVLFEPMSCKSKNSAWMLRMSLTTATYLFFPQIGPPDPTLTFSKHYHVITSSQEDDEGRGINKAQPNKTKTSVHCHKSSAEQQEAVNLGRGECGSQSPSHTALFWFSTELFNCVSRVSISQVQFQGHAWLLSLVFWSCLPVKTHNWNRERLFPIHAPHLKNKKVKKIL